MLTIIFSAVITVVTAPADGPKPPPSEAFAAFPRVARGFSAAEEARLMAIYLKMIRDAPPATVEIVETDIVAAVARYGSQARRSALRVQGMEKEGQRDLFRFMQNPALGWMAGGEGSHWNCLSPAPRAPNGNLP